MCIHVHVLYIGVLCYKLLGNVCSLVQIQVIEFSFALASKKSRNDEAIDEIVL